MQGITVSQFFAIPPRHAFELYTTASLKNVCIFTGGITLLFYLRPQWQLRSLQIESLVAMNLWLPRNILRWTLTAVVPHSLLGLWAKLVIPALRGATYAEGAKSGNIVSRLFSKAFALLGKKRQKNFAFPGEWQHLTILHLSWLPAITYHRWFSFMPQLRSFFYLKSEAAAAVSVVDDLRAALSPQAVFAMDLGCILVERLVSAIRAQVLPALLGDPIVTTKRTQVRQTVSQLISCAGAFWIVCRVAAIPEIPIRTRVFSGDVWTILRPERHLPLIQSFIQAALDQVIDSYVLQRIPLLQGPPSTVEFRFDNLSQREEEMVALIKNKFHITAANWESVERTCTEAFLNPSVCARRRVAFAVVFWAATVIKGRADLVPQQEHLKKYEQQLKRINFNLEDSIAVRQESTMIQAESSANILASQDSFTMDVCAVCLSKLKPEQDMIEIVHCHHVFHTECITSWLQKASQCPCCRFDLDAGKEASQVEQEQPALEQQDVERQIIQFIGTLGVEVPHLLDYEEWGNVRKYCVENDICSNAILSVFRDDTPVNQVTYVDLVVAPLLFMWDAYNYSMTFLRSDYVEYKKK